MQCSHLIYKVYVVFRCVWCVCEELRRRLQAVPRQRRRTETSRANSRRPRTTWRVRKKDALRSKSKRDKSMM